MTKKYIVEKITCLVFLIIILAIPYLMLSQHVLSIPNVNQDQSDQIPVTAMATEIDSYLSSDNKSIQAIQSATLFDEKTAFTPLIDNGPINEASPAVNKATKHVQVIPGGQSIGVQLHTTGVLVVGHHQVNGAKGDVSPGERADIQVGDVILKINDEEIHKMEDVKPYVETAGKENKSLYLTIQRGDESFTTTLKPLLDKKESQYRLGLYIRDSAAGIGTMSFYHPQTKKYGALGHVISDMDTKKPIEIHKGTIVRSSVMSIEKGNNGSPGEKQAKFSVNENKIGTITKNSPFGIFGTLNNPIKNGKYDQPLDIALADEVEEGPATILTVINDEKVEEFDVEVINSISQDKPATKGMVIKVTDPELLKQTGGIVQGMSGSPIIQNNKVIGAVTHVFVNDPTSGYGVHIEWMLQEIDIHVRGEIDQAS